MIWIQIEAEKLAAADCCEDTEAEKETLERPKREGREEAITKG